MKVILTMIRQYKNSDVDAVVSVWRLASDLAHPFLSEEFQDKEQHNVRHIYPQFAEIWVKEHESQVIGFIALIGNELGAIFLHPNYHAQGFGREMMDFAIQQKAHLTLDVFERNKIGRAFYERYGFKPIKHYTHEETGEVTLTLSITK